MSDVSRRTVDDPPAAPKAAAADEAVPSVAATPAASGSEVMAPKEASQAPRPEAVGIPNVNSTSLSEDELDWRENQARRAAEVARTDLLLITIWGLATAAVIAGLVLLYGYVF
jgi:hypothetical protein